MVLSLAKPSSKCLRNHFQRLATTDLSAEEFNSALCYLALFLKLMQRFPEAWCVSCSFLICKLFIAGHTSSLHKSPQLFFIKLVFGCSLLFRYDWTFLQERGKFLTRLAQREEVVFQLLMTCKLDLLMRWSPSLKKPLLINLNRQNSYLRVWSCHHLLTCLFFFRTVQYESSPDQNSPHRACCAGCSQSVDFFSVLLKMQLLVRQTSLGWWCWDVAEQAAVWGDVGSWLCCNPAVCGREHHLSATGKEASD